MRLVLVKSVPYSSGSLSHHIDKEEIIFTAVLWGKKNKGFFLT